MIEGYPKMMKHPAYQPAIISNSRKGDMPGQPVRFPPVWVNNPDQEEYHKSLGYAPG